MRPCRYRLSALTSCTHLIYNHVLINLRVNPGVSAGGVRQGEASMDIRLATEKDRPAIWAMLEPVIRAGETYALDVTMNHEPSRGAGLLVWCG